MKVVFTLNFIFLFHCCFSQTTIPGGAASGTWTLAGSPYNVQGSIQVPNNDSLIIQPGVKVNFSGAFKLVVSGKLKAIGTISDTIVFTNSDTSTGWRGIRFINTNNGNDSSVFTYCRFKNGKANGTLSDVDGGALYILNFSKVRVSHCEIINCFAASKGGGIFIDNANPLILSNAICYNRTNGQYGGGIYAHSCSSIFAENEIRFNISHSGAGIYLDSGNPTFQTNIISDNSIYTTGGNTGTGGIITINCTSAILNNTIKNNIGGGIVVNSNGGSVISGNFISGNTLAKTGGGINAVAGVLIENNIITYNSCELLGGGIAAHNCMIRNNFICDNSVAPNPAEYCGGGGIGFGYLDTSEITGNVIANNEATYGGACVCYNGAPNFLNNTIVNNNAFSKGGAWSCLTSSPTFINCIVHGNTANSGSQINLFDEDSDPSFAYCEVEGGVAAFELNGNFYTGTWQNNVDSIPMFVSPSSGAGTSVDGFAADWSLQFASKCINGGDPTSQYPPTDIAGNPRIINSTIDIGAYESQLTSFISEFLENPIFFVFPNPTKGKLMIHSEEEILQMIITSEFGEVVDKSVLQNQTSVDLTSLPNGIYILHIIGNKSSIKKKIILTN
jgi:hypothetical protein